MLSALLSLLYRRWLQGEVMFPAMRHSVKLINKKTRNMSSALKIATAKCVHWSYCLTEGGYKLPQCSRWIPNIFLSLPLSLSLSLSMCLILPLFLRPVWCMISFVCLSPHYHVVWITIITARQHQRPAVDRNRVELTLPAELLQSIQYLLRWGLTYSGLFKWYRDDAGYSYRLHRAP